MIILLIPAAWEIMKEKKGERGVNGKSRYDSWTVLPCPRVFHTGIWYF